MKIRNKKFVFVAKKLMTTIGVWRNFLVEKYARDREFIEERLKRINEKKLPFIYKLILKIPMPSLDSFPAVFHGIFWAIIVPIFMVIIFFSILFSLIYFAFPINIVLMAIFPSSIFLVFTRILLERFIRGWNAMVEEPKSEWNVEKLMDEYIDILKKQKGKEES